MRTASLVLILTAFVLPARAQETLDAADVERRLRELARAGDAPAREEALKAFRKLPATELQAIHDAAARLGDVEKAAARTWVPHPAWASIFPGTIGDLRRELRDFYRYNTPTVRAGRLAWILQFGRAPARPREEVKQALVKLLAEGDSSARLFALEAGGQFGVIPEPKMLLALLEDSNKDVAAAAAVLLMPSGDETLVPAVFKIFKSHPTADAQTLARFLSTFGTPELVPELLQLLKERPEPLYPIVSILGALGDERVEPALLDRLQTADLGQTILLTQTLQNVGGRRTIEAVRKHRESLPADDGRRNQETMLLFRLRDSGLSKDLLERFREGKTPMTEMGGSFLRVGDPSVVPELIRFIREGKPKIEDRNAALHVIGVLGGEGVLPVLVEHLKDGRFAEAAAAGLAELRDAASVRPLAEALKVADTPEPFVRALSRLPLAEAETTLLEILDDPEGHDKVAPEAARLAGLAATPRLREKLLAVALAEETPALVRLSSVGALALLVGPADREMLAKRRSDGNSMADLSIDYLLTRLGDVEATRRFVTMQGGTFARWVVDGRDNVLLSFRTPSKQLVDEVELRMGISPDWVEGAEFLAYQGKKTGEALLVRQMDRLKGRFIDVRPAAALLAAGCVDPVESLFWKTENVRLPLAVEEKLARAMKEDSVVRLREQAAARRTTYDQAPGRLLALREDSASVRLFQSVVRADFPDNPVQPQSNTTVMALALAKMKVKDSRRDFLRLLRSNVQAKRALGLECLGILGDPSAIAVIAPFLDDLQPISRRPFGPAEAGEEGSVADEAVRAIERLTGETFAGTPRERRAAAKARAAKETEKK